MKKRNIHRLSTFKQSLLQGKKHKDESMFAKEFLNLVGCVSLTLFNVKHMILNSEQTTFV